MSDGGLLDVADEYQRMGEAGILAPDERVELIEGEIIVMPPIGSAHAGLVIHLNHLLTRAVDGRALVNVQNPVRLSDLSEPEPDLALLRPRDDFYTGAHPTPADTLLAIEISDTTLAYDRDVKVPMYARHDIPEVWVIDVKGKRLLVYRTPDGNGYAHRFTHAFSEPIEPVHLPGAALDLSMLFTED